MNDPDYIGVISDTHGLVRPEAKAILTGSQLIIHAGDIGDPSVIDALEEIAPVTAIRGNVDKGSWCSRHPEFEVIEFKGFVIYMLHNLQELNLDPKGGGFAAVVFGHSHQPKNETLDGILYFNPGSAGPRRFSLPITVGKLYVMNGTLLGEIIELQP